jgi:protein translocase SecG subunit
MSFLTIIQLIVAITLIALILLQERSSGTSGLFGGTEGGFYQRRRGMEKGMYIATITLIAIFALLSIVILIQQ